MEKFEKQVVGYTSVCHGLVHVLELAYGVVLISIAQEFGASLFILGILANVMGFAFGFAALPTGFLADRTSERNLLIFCCLGMGVSSIAIGGWLVCMNVLGSQKKLPFSKAIDSTIFAGLPDS